MEQVHSGLYEIGLLPNASYSGSVLTPPEGRIRLFAHPTISLSLPYKLM